MDTKNWWESKTVWANIMAVVLSLAVTFGLLTADQSASIGGMLPDTMAMIGAVVANVIAIWARITTTKTIG